MVRIRRLTDERARGVATCIYSSHEAPLEHFGERKRGGHNSYCRSCKSRHTGVRNAHAAGRAPVRPYLIGDELFADNETRRLADEINPAADLDKPIARDLGIRRKDRRQTDISIECAKAGVEPGRDLRRRALPEQPELVAEQRQAKFEAREAQPQKESRQVRRARERRLVKDARAAFTRQLSNSEAVSKAIDRAISARIRAAGGSSTPRVRRHKAVRWQLTPVEVGEIMRAQGYRCALTGEPFRETTEYGSSNPFSPSPNRIVPGGDYVATNCEFVAWYVNRMISDMPLAKALEFLRERRLLRKDFLQPDLFVQGVQ